jgi:Ca2+-binding RTX toxin-like protein
VGTDKLVFASATGGVRASLQNGLAQHDNVEVDRLAGFENILGSGFDDVLFGDALDNVIEGRVGNDVLVGGDGKDTLNGGAGSDVLQRGVGADIFSFVAVSDGAVDIITDFFTTTGDQLMLGEGIIISKVEAGFLSTDASANGFALGNKPGSLDLVLTGAGGTQTLHILKVYSFSRNAYWEGALGIDLDYAWPVLGSTDLVTTG